MRLLSNNPDKSEELGRYGIEVSEVIGLALEPNEHNLAYLRTKRDRLGHALPNLERMDLASLEATGDAQ